MSPATIVAIVVSSLVAAVLTFFIAMIVRDRRRERDRH
jgi:hypothetical protein